MGKRLLDKLWERHVVATNENGLDLLYIDLHLVHEVRHRKPLKACGLQIERYADQI